MNSKKVVIVGCGFAGLNLAKGLMNHDQFQVTIIDKENYHLFQPLLYQVAMAGLNPSDIATPIRSIFSKAKNIAGVGRKIEAHLIWLIEVESIRLRQ